MNIEHLLDHCMAKKGVEETFPFGPDTLVFKVMGKVFALISLSNPNQVNLKCNPEKAIEILEPLVQAEADFTEKKAATDLLEKLKVR